MKSMNKLFVLVAVLIFVLVAVLFSQRTTVPDKSQSGTVNDEYSRTLDGDRETLRNFQNGSEKDEYKIYGAMIRLGEVRDERAYKIAIDMAKSESRLRREGAAQTLAYYTKGDATELLVELLSDSEPSVKEFAARGLGQVHDPARLEKVEELLKSNALSATQRLNLLSSFYLLSDIAGKTWAVDQMTSLASSLDTSEAATLLLVQIAPEDKATTQLLYKKIEEGSSERVLGVGIRHLASRQDPWMAQNLAKFARHSSPIVRKAVIQSLHRICPSDRWSLLTKMIDSETDKSTIEVSIREAALLSGPEAKKFIDDISTHNLHHEAEVLIVEVKKQLAADQNASPCLQP